MPPDAPAAEGAVDVMTIGQFAQSTGLSARALRLYDERGLLEPASTDAVSGYRLYRRDQIRRGAQLAVLRRMGVPLEQAGSVLDEPDRAEERLDAHTAEVLERHAAERAALRSGRALLEAYEQPVALHRRHAAAQPWVGVVLDVPDEPGSAAAAETLGDEAANAAFGGLHQALSRAGIEVTGPWSTTLSVSEDGGSVQLILCWPVAALPGPDFGVDGFRVTTGVLPERSEALVEVRHPDDSSADQDDQAMAGIPIAAALHLEEQLGEGDTATGGQVRQIGLLDEHGCPVGVELVITVAEHAEREAS